MNPAQTLGNRTLGNRLDNDPSRDNLITPARVVLAAIVAIWHGFVIAGTGADEPSIGGLSPSYLAVNGFFILSGLLIARSVERRDLVQYALARALRLYPALIALLACGAAFALAVHLAGPGGANAEGASFLYPLKSLLFLDASGNFPGLFAGNPRPEFSLPLWTLRYEALAYLAMPVLLLAGLLARPARIWTLWACAALGFAALSFVPEAPALAREGARLVAAFLLGSAIYVIRTRIRLSGWELGGALLLAVALYPTPLFEAAANLVLAWALLALCFARAPIRAPLSRMPDWSYGLYIWHWPVFQALKSAFPQAGAADILILGMPVALGLAAASWRFVERPALAARAPLAALLGRALDRVPGRARAAPAA